MKVLYNFIVIERSEDEKLLNSKEVELRERIRKKYVIIEEKLYFVNLRKLIVRLGVTWSSFYRFINYGENCLSIDTLELIEKNMKKELSYIKKEIEVLLEEL